MILSSTSIDLTELPSYTKPDAVDAPDNCLAGQRLGKFRIANELLRGATDFWLSELFSYFVITRAEAIYHAKCVEYVAASILFEPIEVGEMPRCYNITVDGHEGRQEISCFRIDPF